MFIDPPRILSGPGELTVTVVPGQEHTEPPTVTFTCIVDANEDATILWFSLEKFGRLSNGPLYEREGDDSPPTAVISEDGTQLTLLNVERGTSDEYACLATNSQGSDSSKGYLKHIPSS